MLNQATLSRPYARAAFETARRAGEEQGWSDALVLAAAIMDDGDARRLAGDPRLSPEDVLSLFADVGGERFGPQFRNFLRLLLTYDRLPLLAEIRAQFETLRQQAEQRLKVQVTSAVAMTPEQQSRLADSLKRRLGRDVDLENDVDPALLAGAMIRAGDHVIDASVRGRLNRLAQRLTE